MNWAVSNRVLTEYEEIIGGKAGPAAWANVARLIDHQFHIIGSDPDDNAFTDCAIAAHADYVITEDRHFAPLANARYNRSPSRRMSSSSGSAVRTCEAEMLARVRIAKASLTGMKFVGRAMFSIMPLAPLAPKLATWECNRGGQLCFAPGGGRA
jgi:hypothetical protein